MKMFSLSIYFRDQNRKYRFRETLRNNLTIYIKSI